MSVSFPNGDPRSQFALMERALREGAYDACRTASIAGSALAKKTLTDLEAVDQNILRASVSFEVTKTAAGAQGVVYTGALHGPWVEFGRAGVESDPRSDKTLGARAGWPPFIAIFEWVKRHFKSLAPSGRTKSGRARKPQLNDLNRVTFLIRRKIYRFGIKPRPWLVPSFSRIAQFFPGMVYDAAAKRLADAFRSRRP